MSDSCTTSSTQDELTSSSTFTPTQKEFDQFNKDKQNMYKGTYIVCLVYGLIAVGMLLAIFLTEWGRDYIYGKLLPAVATFVFGALFIIIYLAFTIYDLKPRRIRNKSDMDQDVVCPDYWKLELVNDAEKIALVDNNRAGNIFKSIQTTNDNTLKYKCKIDPNVLELDTLDSDTRLLHNTNKFNYKKGYMNSDSGRTSADYVYVDTDNNSFYTNDSKLTNYAKFSGMYNDKSDASNSTNVKDYTVKASESAQDTSTFYQDKRPLICNTVYPQVLANLDKETPEQNKYRCMYAKACNIPWTGIGCKYETPPL